MKKLVLFIALIATIMTASCKKAPAGLSGGGKVASSVSDANITAMANPWSNFDSLSEAVKVAGFDITLPDDAVMAVKDFDQCDIVYRVLTGGVFPVIEVIYKTSDDEVRIRKVQGERDISGDYNNYDDTKTVTVGDVSYSIKGREGLFTLINWEHDNFSYSLSTIKPKESDLLLGLSKSIK